MNPEGFAWIILFLPLLSAGVITLLTLDRPRVSSQISIAAVVLGFLLSCTLFILLPHGRDAVEVSVDWLRAGGLSVDLGLRLDGLSLVMLLVVTGVASVIHIYSTAYMDGDESYSRFFASLSLFTFSMLGIVLSNNLFQMFIFWELVGVSSYLLIGFWHGRASAADACKKAFLVNRIGDFGFLLGIILVWSMLGTVNLALLESKLSLHPGALGAFSALAGVLLFCGAMGKSAQFPLHVWLPDAMEGPTPVSALIHAATMVAAGVYMLCRIFFIFQLPQVWPSWLGCLSGLGAGDIVAWVGGLTALMAALMATQQNDIKRILAYSTLSQLGYMVMSVGVGGPAPAMFHLVTHAFFKAMLFLGAGSVIHALHHEQDIWRMGGLRKPMPLTHGTFLVGTLALCGVPPFSGFYSKDAILAAAYTHKPVLFGLAVVVATLTAFYMARLYLVAFAGPGRSEAAGHVSESPRVMTAPLLALAVPSVLCGFWGIDGLLAKCFKPASHTGGHEVLESAAGPLTAALEPFAHAPAAALFGLGATVFGFSFAYALYAGRSEDPVPGRIQFLSRLFRNRFYLDEAYQAVFVRLQDGLAWVADFVDRWILAGLGVKGTQGTVELTGRALRLLQTGSLQTYAFLFVAGLVLVLAYALNR